MSKEVNAILKENAKRVAENTKAVNPITGLGSIGERTKVVIKDFPLKEQWLPVAMLKDGFVSALIAAGSIKDFIKIQKKLYPNDYGNDTDRLKIIDMFVRIRYKHDFPFWAASLVYIKTKGGGEDILFRLTRPQRKFISFLESKRTNGEPIRLVLLKARQWGGSTASQMYMAWLQLVHKVGLNSLIIAHQSSGTDEIKDMFDRMINAYPIELLHQLGDAYNENERKLVGVGKSGAIFRVPQRNCKIKVGTAEKPDSCRGGDYNLVHLSEVGVWKATDGKKPEDIVRSACSGVLITEPMTMIIYESTANGTGNFFQREYDAAKRGTSQFSALFIAWYDIDLYSLPFKTDDDLTKFAEWLYKNRNGETAFTDREEPGAYLWRLWELGATLEGIHWYVEERKKYRDHGDMASEYPSDDVEAFVHSGERVFDRYKIEKLRKSCRPPKYVGDVYGDDDSGKGAFKHLKFSADAQGMLRVWALPEIDEDEIVTNRYLVVVDIGGRSGKADWSVICVFDRMMMIDGEKPVVVAQWYGHIDMDILAWKAAQIAAFYDNALLVIESNTLETHDKERSVDGDQSSFILNQIKEEYDNLYARKQSEEDIIEGRPRKYGFHTNVSTKPMIISTLVKVIRDGLYIERDEECLNEYECYERKQNGAFGAIVGRHDDLLMTRAIGLHICFHEMDMPKIKPRQKTVRPSARIAKGAATI
jgi:hypothetical protein